MTDKTYFLSPIFGGKRFENHAIPLVLLKDIAVLQDLIAETARWHFLEENPNRTRMPNGFLEWGRLELVAVDEGSAIPQIDLAIPDDVPDSDDQHYFTKAKNSITDAIKAASTSNAANDDQITDHLPPELLGYFDRIGRGLRDDEYIDFLTSNGQPARLNINSRKRLTKASKLLEYTKEVLIRGSVAQIKQDTNTFKVDLIVGNSVEVPLAPEYIDTVFEASRTYNEKNIRYVVIKGIAKFARTSLMQSFESVEHVRLLEPLDIGARLDELRKLKKGWLNEESPKLSHAGLSTLSSKFDQYYSSGLRLPYLFPTEEGDVLAEWQTDTQNISLEVTIDDKSEKFLDAILLMFDMDGDNDQEKALNLKDSASWQTLNETLLSILGTEDSGQ